MVFRSIVATAASTASSSSSSSSSSAAAQTIQRRAIQCSFSSVFHLRNAGAGRKEAQEAERIFFNAVAVPMGIMGLVGGAAFVHKSFFADEAAEEMMGHHASSSRVSLWEKEETYLNRYLGREKVGDCNMVALPPTLIGQKT
eukprot:CAMPEP_0197716534 /NCGR_PEP_ID=MMETSP1434-20131217/1394_1 /TAXON_ID=265543 /ORGANISM="Minutocellus polymorphus, Strain CCMP3303" /LENGTH=141 /DNA_ID=CAMNT_0043300911 /DNA_START=61 /DNA_END=485 /DNA_ORIENTATION=-